MAELTTAPEVAKRISENWQQIVEDIAPAVGEFSEKGKQGHIEIHFKPGGIYRDSYKFVALKK